MTAALLVHRGAQEWQCRMRLGFLTVPGDLDPEIRGELARLDRASYDPLWGHRPALIRRAPGWRGRLLGRTEVVPPVRPAKLPGELQADLLRAVGVEEAAEEFPGNLLVYGGASVMWQTLIGNGTTTAGQALTYFNAANAALGVGDSTTGAAATQTNLQASSNKLRVGMDSTYPSHTDATSSGAASIVFRASFATGQANYAWNEWGVFSSPTDATGRMLNRKVESLGTKTSSSVWTLTVTLSLA